MLRAQQINTPTESLNTIAMPQKIPSWAAWKPNNRTKRNLHSKNFFEFIIDIFQDRR
jgi:hypothetical protein